MPDSYPYDDPSDPAEGSGMGWVLFVLGALTGMAGMGLVQTLVPAREEPDVAFYRDVRELVRTHFVEEIDERELLDEALRGAVGSLDGYSRYYTTDELPRLDRETEGEYRGIGVIFREPFSAYQILFPLPDSPAEAAGLRVGDRVVVVDGVDVSTLDEPAFRRALREPAQDALSLEVEGLDGGRRQVSVEPTHVLDPTVRHARIVDGERGLGYLAIRSFSKRTPGEFDDAVEALERRGLRGLVIDLRGNPGGVMDAATAIANRFVAGGPLVVTISRDGREVEEAEADRATLAGMPLVVLVDADSASASEILAGALQDHRAGVLAGVPTYGKGAVQTLARYDDRAAVVKLTTSYYTTPAGRVIDRELGPPGRTGLAPDLFVDLDEASKQEVRAFLGTYGPPPDALTAIEDWERSLGEDVQLAARHPRDEQLDAALDLLRGRHPLLARAE